MQRKQERDPRGGWKQDGVSSRGPKEKKVSSLRGSAEPNVGERQGGLRLRTFIAFGGEDAMGLWRGCCHTVVVEVDPVVLWVKGRMMVSQEICEGRLTL